MTKLTDEQLNAALRANPELRAAGVKVEPRPEPPLAKAKRLSFVPTESQDQIAVVEWAALHEGRCPELAMLFHVPNEGKRSEVGGGILVAMGLRSGIPDLLLPVARQSKHGLAIEMKRVDHSRDSSDEQLRWQDAFHAQGWRVVVAYGFDEAIAALRAYMEMNDE